MTRGVTGRTKLVLYSTEWKPVLGTAANWYLLTGQRHPEGWERSIAGDTEVLATSYRVSCGVQVHLGRHRVAP